MIRVLVRSAAALLFLAVLAFPLDWLLWRLRVVAGGGMDRITVREVTAASLKGSKVEYYIDGAVEVDCSRSVFPQSGAGACWWLRRQKEIVTEQ